MAMGTEWVLWGSHPHYAGGALIKIMGGTYREACHALKMRKQEGWARLQIKQATDWNIR